MEDRLEKVGRELVSESKEFELDDEGLGNPWKILNGKLTLQMLF